MVVAAIAVNSRIAAAAVVAGSAVAVAAGCFLGVSEAFIRSGLLAYNAALTALALGGFFILLDRAGAIYATLGVVLTTCVWGCARDRARPVRTARSNASLRYRHLADAARGQGLPGAADDSA